jgi:hypothetical protein
MVADTYVERPAGLKCKLWPAVSEAPWRTTARDFLIIINIPSGLLPDFLCDQTWSSKRQGLQHLKCDFAQSNIAVGKEWSATLLVYRFLHRAILQVGRSGVLHLWFTGFQNN